MSLPSLSQSQLDQFKRDGYLAIPEFSPEYTSLLLSRSKEIVDAFDSSTHPKTQFNTSEDENHIGDDYFLSSGDKVRYFLEPDALDSTGGLLSSVSSWQSAINKIGHGLHFHEPLFKDFAHSTRLIASSLGFKTPLVLQSMVYIAIINQQIICKPPFVGGVVPAHIDSTFLYTSPPSAVGFWYSIEGAGY
jgi:phytanoyl-CoA hydroxylase